MLQRMINIGARPQPVATIQKRATNTEHAERKRESPRRGITAKPDRVAKRRLAEESRIVSAELRGALISGAVGRVFGRRVLVDHEPLSLYTS